MKDIEEIKQEIRSLINEAADQGVLLTEITADFLTTTLEGRGTTTRIHIEETRLK